MYYIDFLMETGRPLKSQNYNLMNLNICNILLRGWCSVWWPELVGSLWLGLVSSREIGKMKYRSGLTMGQAVEQWRCIFMGKLRMRFVQIQGPASLPLAESHSRYTAQSPGTHLFRMQHWVKAPLWWLHIGPRQQRGDRRGFGQDDKDETGCRTILGQDDHSHNFGLPSTTALALH